MRPRVKPALRRIIRDKHTLQYGAHPLRAVMLSGLTEAVRRWIEGLDGTRDLECVLSDAAAAGLDEIRARSLLDQLAAQGALHDAATSPAPIADLSLAERDRLRPDLDALDLASTAPDGAIGLIARRRERRVRVYGAGRVGAQVAALLAASGVGTIRILDPATARPCDITPGGLTWAEVGLPREVGSAMVARRLTSGGRTPTARRSPAASTATTTPKPIATTGTNAAKPIAIAGTGSTRASDNPRATANGPRAEGAPTAQPAQPQRPQAGKGPRTTRATQGTRIPRTEEDESGPRPSVNAMAGGPYLGDQSDRPDLVILTPVAPLDGVLVNELTLLGIPHLLASAFEGHGTVGPLVIPGKTACLHCLDLTRRDRDPMWPIVTARLGGYPPGEIACDVTLAALVAAAVAGHALAYLDGRESAVTNGTMDVTPDWRWKRRSWTIHPQCRCMRNNPYSLRMVMSPNRD
ncbi:thiamine biosynthesis protein ThiF [Nonomuraea angiospora]|uniref:thiamine biosynthesis protein ThiF n=1 Tax=Nonomuraea angiospora TaxID=46172 RepID=UPI0033256308